MESILEGKDKKFKQIMLPVELTKKLEAMNKRSYAEAIRFLLNSNPDNSLKVKVQELEGLILELQVKFESLVRTNKLRF